MLEADSPKMNPYSEINPYYLIYCNMNIRISEDVSKEAAENVVRQIGYLHNAMGCVFKDLIKILAFRFPEPLPPHPPHAHVPSRPAPHTHVSAASSRQPMDIESDHGEFFPRGQKGNRGRGQQERGVLVENTVRQQQVDVVVVDANKQQPKPPNTDIFDEYAYSKELPAEGNRDKDIIKMGIAKVIEGAQRKKREGRVEVREGREKEGAEKDRPTEGQKKPMGSDRQPREQEEREKRPQPSENPMRQLFNKPIEPQEDAEIFSEFVFENKPQQVTPPPLPKPPLHSGSPPLVEKGQDESRLWQFLRQKQAPAVYEISDDEDNQ